MHSIAVAIVSYGTSDLVVASLPRLLQELKGYDHRVFVVDNASPHGDGAKLADGIAKLAPGPHVIVLQSEKNGGFAAGNNIAINRIREGSWRPNALLLLNPDACVKPGAITEMMRILETKPKAGFVGPRIAHPDGSTWTAAFHFPSFGTEVIGALSINALSRHFPTVVKEMTEPTRVDWVTGTATLIRWAALEEIGDMDDGYFLYYEEVDYMLQGYLYGWESWHAPLAIVSHAAGSSTGLIDGRPKTGRQPPYWFDSWARYFAKNHGTTFTRLLAICKLGAMLFAHLHRAIRGKAINRPERFYRDFTRNVILARLSPPPMSGMAKSAPRAQAD